MRAFAQRCGACAKLWLKFTATGVADTTCPYCGSDDVTATESWTWQPGPPG